MIRTGSTWTDSSHRRFHVINTTEVNGKVWVFYKLENPEKHNENTEFSCYEESFIARFSPYENQR